jgi:phage terminase large subunit-like protein
VSLAYFEWSAADGADLDDRGAWAQANPALGIRVSEEFITWERAALGDAEFARERLGIWDDPAATGLFDLDRWNALADRRSGMPGVPTFAVDVTPDRQFGCLGAAGARADGLLHVEVVELDRGTGWLVDRMAEIARDHGVSRLVLDPSSPAASLTKDMEDLGLEVVPVSSVEYAQACGVLFDLVTEGKLRHLGQLPLDTAVAGARQRHRGDAFVWNRRTPTVNISPLVAVTLALHGHLNAPPPSPRTFFGGLA